VCVCVCVCVCLLITTVSTTKTVELIQMSFGMLTRVGRWRRLDPPTARGTLGSNLCSIQAVDILNRIHEGQQAVDVLNIGYIESTEQSRTAEHF